MLRHSELVMAKKLLSKKQVKERVLYSYAHTARLEAKGQFPKRVRLCTAVTNQATGSSAWCR